jgi:predicted PurR-regulated permease PerM
MEKDIKSIKNLLLILLAILAVYLLSVLSSLLIPLALALFIVILLQPTLAWFQSKKWPFTLSLSAISITTLSVLWLLGVLFYKTGESIASQKGVLLGQIQIKLNNIILWVNTMPGVAINTQDIINTLSQLMSYDWLLESSGHFAGILGDFTGTFFMTALYLIGLLGGILKYEEYIHYLEEGNAEKEEKLLAGFEYVKSSIVTYMKVKFQVSLMTGFGYFIICWAFGINFALFWGFLAFLLNFIPTVGSIIATIPPLLLGLIQVDSMGVIVLLFAMLMIVQVVIGNIVEPKMQGRKLSLNTVVVILGLVFWGYLWGVTGMILSVPLLVLTKVILSQMPDAQLMMRLMGSGPDDD